MLFQWMKKIFVEVENCHLVWNLSVAEVSVQSAWLGTQETPELQFKIKKVKSKIYFVENFKWQNYFQLFLQQYKGYIFFKL